jgi:pilus assembly protein Flp/PilA
MKRTLEHLLVDTEGQDLIEYALLAALIALAAVAAMQTLGGAINAKFDNASTSLTTAS